MKKAIFIICILLLSASIFAQTKMDLNSLIGYWEPDQHSTQMVIWKDVDGKFQMVEFSTNSGDALTLLSMKIVDSSLVVKTVFEPKNFFAESVFTLVDKDTLVCKIKNNPEVTITYTKVK